MVVRWNRTIIIEFTILNFTFKLGRPYLINLIYFTTLNNKQIYIKIIKQHQQNVNIMQQLQNLNDVFVKND